MSKGIDGHRRVSGTDNSENGKDAAFPRLVKYRLVKLRTNRAEPVCPANIVYAVHRNPRVICKVLLNHLTDTTATRWILYDLERDDRNY